MTPKLLAGLNVSCFLPLPIPHFQNPIRLQSTKEPSHFFVNAITAQLHFASHYSHTLMVSEESQRQAKASGFFLAADQKTPISKSISKSEDVGAMAITATSRKRSRPVDTSNEEPNSKRAKSAPAVIDRSRSVEATFDAPVSKGTKRTKAPPTTLNLTAPGNLTLAQSKDLPASQSTLAVVYDDVTPSQDIKKGKLDDKILQNNSGEFVAPIPKSSVASQRRRVRVRQAYYKHPRLSQQTDTTNNAIYNAHDDTPNGTPHDTSNNATKGSTSLSQTPSTDRPQKRPPQSWVSSSGIPAIVRSAETSLEDHSLESIEPSRAESYHPNKLRSSRHVAEAKPSLIRKMRSRYDARAPKNQSGMVKYPDSLIQWSITDNLQMAKDMGQADKCMKAEDCFISIIEDFCATYRVDYELTGKSFPELWAEVKGFAGRVYIHDERDFFRIAAIPKFDPSGERKATLSPVLADYLAQASGYTKFRNDCPDIEEVLQMEREVAVGDTEIDWLADEDSERTSITSGATQDIESSKSEWSSDSDSDSDDEILAGNQPYYGAYNEGLWGKMNILRKDPSKDSNGILLKKADCVRFTLTACLKTPAPKATTPIQTQVIKKNPSTTPASKTNMGKLIRRANGPLNFSGRAAKPQPTRRRVASATTSTGAAVSIVTPESSRASPDVKLESEESGGDELDAARSSAPQEKIIISFKRKRVDERINTSQEVNAIELAPKQKSLTTSSKRKRVAEQGDPEDVVASGPVPKRIKIVDGDKLLLGIVLAPEHALPTPQESATDSNNSHKRQRNESEEVDDERPAKKVRVESTLTSSTSAESSPMSVPLVYFRHPRLPPADEIEDASADESEEDPSDEAKEGSPEEVEEGPSGQAKEGSSDGVAPEEPKLSEEQGSQFSYHPNFLRHPENVALAKPPKTCNFRGSGDRKPTVYDPAALITWTKPFRGLMEWAITDNLRIAKENREAPEDLTPPECFAMILEDFCQSWHITKKLGKKGKTFEALWEDVESFGGRDPSKKKQKDKKGKKILTWPPLLADYIAQASGYMQFRENCEDVWGVARVEEQTSKNTTEVDYSKEIIVPDAPIPPNHTLLHGGVIVPNGTILRNDDEESSDSDAGSGFEDDWDDDWLKPTVRAGTVPIDMDDNDDKSSRSNSNSEDDSDGN
ncbi:hypothetical protein BT63DRAFT_418427 [Microthyrium microscopicum]|uniref:Uncharacterized protein n=1 Tax=Microthyrium microscopicum TaxID=703497 RepID=A0A6A6TZL5_9PEZI|nr:hypothetical protein BT63DRAFT_418427 [Microthyrium microscopicum]